jgi:hypothetical protein
MNGGDTGPCWCGGARRDWISGHRRGVAAAQTGAATTKGDRAGVDVGQHGRGAAAEAPAAEAMPGAAASPATGRGLGGGGIGREGAAEWASGGRSGGPRTGGCGWSWGVTLGFLR